MAQELMKFAVRIDDEDGIDVEAFKQAVAERGDNREELVRDLIRQFLKRVAEPEEYYTIKGYSDDHQRYADIVNMDGYVMEHSSGFDDDSTNDWRILEHARDLVERNQEGDKEAVIKLFQGIFGERNVFVKEDE